MNVLNVQFHEVYWMDGTRAEHDPLKMWCRSASLSQKNKLFNHDFIKKINKKQCIKRTILVFVVPPLK